MTDEEMAKEIISGFMADGGIVSVAFKGTYRLKDRFANALSQARQEGREEVEQRLSQAEAENQVLRDENVAYNKNYLNLMDVGGNVVEALENYMGKFGDCGETYEIARRSLLNWQDVKEDSRG